MQPPRFEIAPCPPERGRAACSASSASAARWRRCSCAAATASPRGARAFLAADEEHARQRFRRHRRGRRADPRARRAPGRRITIHGDYDVDGVCSTAILVRALRALGADVDSYLPDRAATATACSEATVRRLAARGTQLLVTADCAITAVEEVRARARARHGGRRHRPPLAARRRARCRDAPIVHPALCGYPCARAVRDGRRLQARRRRCSPAAGRDAGELEQDLDLVALATVADVVPLLGENRTLVRRGLRALAATRKPGLRALMSAARVDAGARRRALGRLRAGAAHQRRRAPVPRRRRPRAGAHRGSAARRRRSPQSSIAPTPSAAQVETRIRCEAEAQIAELGERARLRAGRRGLARGRDRHRRRAPGRAPPPPGRADRARRRAGPRLGPQHRRLRPARRPERLCASTCSATAGIVRPRAWRSTRASVAGVRARRSTRMPRARSRRRTWRRSSASTRSSAATSWAWSWPRSCRRWRRSAAPTRACR